MTLLRSVLLRLAWLVLFMATFSPRIIAAQSNCTEMDPMNGPIVPCLIDPWAESRKLFDVVLQSETEETDISDLISNTRASFGAASDLITATKTLLEKKSWKKGLKAIAGLAQFSQYAGPILDIVMLFLPEGKSAELKAIEKGFDEVNGKLSDISNKLGSIHSTIEYWIPIATTLSGFESSVEHGAEKYSALATCFDENDTSSGVLPTRCRAILEDLVNYVGTTGHIGRQLDQVMKFVRGQSIILHGKSLLRILEDTIGHDCSKLTSFSYTLFRLVRNAQKLQYFYEVNKGLSGIDDVQGYSRQLYDIYISSTTQFASCMRNALNWAKEDAESMVISESSLANVVETLSNKYGLYHWAAVEERDVEKYPTAFDSSGPQHVEVYRNEAEDRIKQLSLYVVPKSNTTKIKQAVDFVKNVLPTLKVSLRFSCPKNPSEALMYDALRIISDELRRNNTDIWNKISQNMAMLLIQDEDTQDSMKASQWHHSQTIAVRCTYWVCSLYDCIQFIRTYNLKLGFLFNFEDVSSHRCENGNTIRLSYGRSYPICLCDYHYGGDSCQIKVQRSTSVSSSVVNIAGMYRVPGMFDLEEQIKQGVEKTIRKIENSKLEILSKIEENRGEMRKNRDAILSAQSLLLNELKSDNARLFREFSGLKNAMDEFFRRERDERILSTKQGQMEVIHTIVELAKETTNDLINLDGRIIENRYFDGLKLHIPVFQQKFLDATGENATELMKLEFSNYLCSYKHSFYMARQSVKHAIVGSGDSFIIAQMKQRMISGCTSDYHQQILSTWADVLLLHSSTYIIEFWDLDYRIGKFGTSSLRSDCMARISTKGHLTRKKKLLTFQAKADSERFNNVYHHSSCPGFDMTELLGGGCRNSSTYPGQNIPLQCADSTQSVLLTSTGNEVITDVTCNGNLQWSVNITDLKCVGNCDYNNVIYVIGQGRVLPEPSTGFRWVDEHDNTITEATCLAFYADAESNYTGAWSFYQQIDINECATVECGYGGNCINTNGSFTCICPEGFFENEQKICEDVNECTRGSAGATLCLVDVGKGLCRNTIGGYECSCLSRAYLLEDPTHQCSECVCDTAGVTAEYCDGRTGRCICKANVDGDSCGRCSDGYTNFPFCTVCDTGYYGYPDCQRCSSCNSHGVTLEVCNKYSGDCICRDNILGSQCNKCCLGSNCENDYTSFPACSPIVIDGTLSSWGSWNSWHDIGTCGISSGYDQVRTRTRTCNDGTKNRHGRSCIHDVKSQKQTVWKDVCRPLSAVSIRVPRGLYAGSTGNFGLKIYQGSIACTTIRNTFSRPGTGTHSETGTLGCTKTFDVTKSINVKPYTDSHNDMYLVGMSIVLGTHRKSWSVTNYVKYNYERGGYQTLS